MKFKIETDYVPTLVLNEGWDILNAGALYVDLERTLWSHELPGGDKVFYTQRVSLSQDSDDLDWVSASVAFIRDTPGDDDNAYVSANITVEEAVRLLGELK